MSAVIRLSRQGKKGKPVFRIVVQDKRFKTGGKVIENLGIFDPQVNPVEIRINKERLAWWSKNGALISPAVKKLIPN